MDLTEAKVRLSEEGYCILENQLPSSDARCFDAQARALMESEEDSIQKSERYLSMEDGLNQMPEIMQLCIHPPVIELAKSVVGEKFILSNTVAMKWCRPGAQAGGLHADWPLGAGVPEPWPLLPTGFVAFWMLSDFTQKNGATAVVPFSHHSRRPPSRDHYPQEIPLVGKRGSVALFVNGLWHRSGANTTSDQHRMAASMFYTPEFLHRPRQGWPLVKRELYNKFPSRMQQLLARSVEI